MYLVGNKRNGKGSKTLKTTHGEVTINTPQDRHSSFDPQLVEKRQHILADSLERQVIAMYGLGTGFRDISAHIEEMYDMDISTQVISEITDRGRPKVILTTLSFELTVVFNDTWLYLFVQLLLTKKKAVSIETAFF